MIRLFDPWKGHVMDMLLSHKQVVQEKLVSDPTVPSVQKNEKNENKNYDHM